MKFTLIRRYETATNENILQTRGYGKWKFYTYNPAVSIGTFEGVLHVSKDFHCVYKDNSNCLFNVPSQNVAFAVNLSLVKDFEIEK